MQELSSKELEELIRKNQVVLSDKQKSYLKVKRVFDFVCALLGLIVFSPVMLIVAIAIKVDAPKEPIIFKQERVGRDNKPFTVYKFRSMKQGTPELGTTEFTNADRYITKVGAILRKTSLDELPQLWSVLCGTMSLIGERPLILREEEVHFLRNYYGIYQLRPGITGLAQINGRDEMSDFDKVRWDRAYVHNVSLGLDLKILGQTVMKVIKREGVMDDAAKKRAMAYRSEFEETNKFYDDEVIDVEHEEDKKPEEPEESEETKASEEDKKSEEDKEEGSPSEEKK